MSSIIAPYIFFLIGVVFIAALVVLFVPLLDQRTAGAPISKVAGRGSVGAIFLVIAGVIAWYLVTTLL